MFFKRLKNYDPAWLIAAAEYRSGEYPWLAESLEKCVKAKVRSDWYTYFADQRNPNKQGSDWQFQESITLEGTPHGDVVLDIIRKNRVGGIEFLSRVIGETNT